MSHTRGSLLPLLLVLIVDRAHAACNGEDSRCFGATEAQCNAWDADNSVCCFWDDGTDATGYCVGQHSGCDKCAPTVQDCLEDPSIIGQCTWVDTTPECTSSTGEI